MCLMAGNSIEKLIIFKTSDETTPAVHDPFGLPPAFVQPSFRPDRHSSEAQIPSPVVRPEKGQTDEAH
jgi:hypothetical protein